MGSWNRFIDVQDYTSFTTNILRENKDDLHFLDNDDKKLAQTNIIMEEQQKLMSPKKRKRCMKHI